MTLQELRDALAAGDAVGFRGAAGQRVEAWGAGRRAGSRPVEGPRRPKKAAAAQSPSAAKPTPQARPQGSRWARLAPWLLPLLWFLVVAASRTSSAAGWMPGLRP